MATDPRSFAALLCLCFACNMPSANQVPEVHGHRGCRGLMPENTVPAFLKAVELGCDFLEMDVVINGEGAVVVSHEPWMDHTKCLDRDGHPVTADQERSLNIYRMTTADLLLYDCGSVEDPEHPEREIAATKKPLLSDVVSACDDLAGENGMSTPHFNIEIKSDPALYGVFQPKAEEFARIVMAAIDELGISERSIVQSFDPAVLEEVHRIDPNTRIALLVDNADGLEANLARLSFTPAIYSPAFALADRSLVEALHEKDMELAVWTVNSVADMQRMIELDVDAIITDYPDRLILLLEDEP